MALVHDRTVPRSHLAWSKGYTLRWNSEGAGTGVELSQPEGGIQMIAEPDSQRPDEAEDRARGQHENKERAQHSHRLCLISPTNLLSLPIYTTVAFGSLEKGLGIIAHPTKYINFWTDAHSNGESQASPQLDQARPHPLPLPDSWCNEPAQQHLRPSVTRPVP